MAELTFQLALQLLAGVRALEVAGQRIIRPVPHSLKRWRKPCQTAMTFLNLYPACPMANFLIFALVLRTAAGAV